VTGNTVLRSGGNGYQQQQAGDDDRQRRRWAKFRNGSQRLLRVERHTEFSIPAPSRFRPARTLSFNETRSLLPDLMDRHWPNIFEAMTGTGIINSNTVTGLNARRSAFTNSSSGYAVITPIAAAKLHQHVWCDC